jgi:cation:H+ antiporter
MYMQIIIPLVFIIIGLYVLVKGADWLVDGAGSIAKRLGIPSLVIGLTVVAFGTSTPELIVNIFSAIKGSADLALGNIIGSNISNILLILGITAIITNIKVQKSTTWKQIPFALLTMIILMIMVSDQVLGSGSIDILSRSDGLLLLGFFAIFLYYTGELALSGKKDDQDDEEITEHSVPMSVLLLIIGVAGLFFGGKILVDNAVILATAAGLSEALIGLTIVGVGTSLPELAASVVAAMRKQTDLAIGNIVGSNIFNVLWILGITSFIQPLPIGSTVQNDVIIATGTALLLFIFLFIGKKYTVERKDGVFMIGLFVMYIIYIVIRG